VISGSGVAGTRKHLRRADNGNGGRRSPTTGASCRRLEPGHSDTAGMLPRSFGPGCSPDRLKGYNLHTANHFISSWPLFDRVRVKSFALWSKSSRLSLFRVWKTTVSSGTNIWRVFGARLAIHSIVRRLSPRRAEMRVWILDPHGVIYRPEFVPVYPRGDFSALIPTRA
jgi:hypothetical protein